MDFSLNDEQRILLGIIERFIESELRPLENEVERAGHLPGEHAERIFKLSKSMGLYALNMPSELGGGGLNTLDWILAEEQFGRTSDILVRRAFGNAYEILLECEGEQVRRWLAPVVSGERTCSIALTETGAGSDAAGISTRARRKESGWVLSGGKNFISDAHYSDFFVVTAVTRPEDGRDGISAFIVDKSAPGVEVGAEQEMMGLRGTSHAQIYFNDVRLEPECLLGREGEGLKLAYATLGRVRLAQVAARAIG
ncbi:MAG: acyl-CoA dehydrogenase family protein, partial [Albidovulum sp.]|nr:acyl-CoA dehydrogenase family protein [Albidovulum sp.]